MKHETFLWLSCCTDSVIFVPSGKFCLYKNSNAEGPSCSQLLHLTEPVKHSPRKRWIPGLITDPLIWAVRRPHSGLWVSYQLLYVPCVLYMHTPNLNKTFLPTLHTCSSCRVPYDTSTGCVDAEAALGRESEYVFHSKENKELSRALDLPGFHCRMVLTFSQKSIQFQVFQ